MRRCRRCLYPDTKPDLHFDAEGLCSACCAFDKRKEIDWGAREAMLADVLDAGRNDSGYDCIVASSGGKDSHWIALKLIARGWRPLLVTATTCHLTAMGRQNIDNLASYATTIEVTANRAVRARLNRLGLELVGDISWPEHAAIFSTPLRMACALGIPIVFYGECPQEAYGGPPGTEAAQKMTLRWIHEFGGFNGLRPADLVGQAGITDRDMADYLPPTAEEAKRVDLRAYFMGWFFPWDSRANAARARAAGMRWASPEMMPANWWEFENLDNAQTAIHDYLMYRKYGYGRATAQASVDIRTGFLDRRRALRIVEERDGRFPETYMLVGIEEVLDRIRMTRLRFAETCERFAVYPDPERPAC